MLFSYLWTAETKKIAHIHMEIEGGFGLEKPTKFIMSDHTFSSRQKG